MREAQIYSQTKQLDKQIEQRQEMDAIQNQV
jgi:hypothetical protein